MTHAPLVAGGLAAILSLAPLAASAQQTQFGPPIAGLCLFARDAALGGSKAGQAANARLQQIASGIEAELTPKQQAIVAENNALKAGAATIPAAQRQQRAAVLQQQAVDFTQLQQLRSAQLQQTRSLATQSIIAQIDPLLQPLVTSRHCSAVFERTATYGFNPAMDITPALVEALNQKMPTITFNLAPPESVKR